MAEGDHVGAESARNLIDSAAAIAAAQVAAVIGLLFEQPEGGPIVIISPVDATLFQVFAKGLDGTQKLALLHSEGANGKIDRRTLRKQQQASSNVMESLPPESATATRSPSRIMRKRCTASPTFRKRVFSISTSLIIQAGML